MADETRTRIEPSDQFGRTIVLIEDTKKGEVVVDELPFALGPKQDSPVVCLGCYRFLGPDENGGGNNTETCTKCGWPLCSQCSDAVDHKGECQVFSEAKVKFLGQMSAVSGGCSQLDCITPLRVLLKKELDPERWEKEVAPMEYHDTSRRENIEYWNADLNNIAKYLRGPCKLDRFSEDLIMQVIGILEVNAFEGRTAQGYPIRCLYPITGILAHNCVPNTARSIYPSEGYRIRLRAMVDLKKGDQLNHSYTYTLSGTAARQEHIKSGKFFVCKCERCSDPTELGTHFSSFKCSKCDNGLILTTDVFDRSAEWKCTHCEFQTSGDAIQKAVAVMQSEIDEVEAIENPPERLEQTERLFRKFRSVVHPLHFIQTSLRHNLIEMYGRVDGYGMADLPDVMLEHKQDLCEQVLRVLNVFEPGLSRARAMILYEMHVPIVLLAKSGFVAGVLAGDALKAKLQEAVNILDECVDILQFEDPTSQEGILGRVARQAMEQLRISIENL